MNVKQLLSWQEVWLGTKQVEHNWRVLNQSRWNDAFMFIDKNVKAVDSFG